MRSLNTLEREGCGTSQFKKKLNAENAFLFSLVWISSWLQNGKGKWHSVRAMPLSSASLYTVMFSFWTVLTQKIHISSVSPDTAWSLWSSPNLSIKILALSLKSAALTSSTVFATAKSWFFYFFVKNSGGWHWAMCSWNGHSEDVFSVVDKHSARTSLLLAKSIAE